MNHHTQRKLIDSSPNIVRLPTAAPRQVKNNRCKEQRTAGRVLKNAHADTFNHVSHQAREALKRAETIRGIERSPALVLMDALLKTLPIETRQEVQQRIEVAMIEGQLDQSHQQACEVAAFTQPMTYGEQRDMETAFEKLAKGKQS